MRATRKISGVHTKRVDSSGAHTKGVDRKGEYVDFHITKQSHFFRVDRSGVHTKRVYSTFSKAKDVDSTFFRDGKCGCQALEGANRGIAAAVCEL